MEATMIQVRSVRQFIDVVHVKKDEASALCSILDAFPVELLRGRAAAAVDLAETLGARCTTLVRLGRKVSALLEHRGHVGVVIVPLARVLGPRLDPPPTPLAFREPHEHELTALDVARCLILGAAGGYSYAYRDQGGGNLCDDVMPIREVRDVSGLSYGSSVGYHTEDAAYHRDDDEMGHPVFDVLSLAYLRNPHGDTTRVAMADFGEMPKEVVEALRRKQFPALTSLAQGGDANTLDRRTSYAFGNEPLLRFSFARLDERLQASLPTEALLAMRALGRHLDGHSAAIAGDVGDVAFIDNMRVAHARGPWTVEPSHDGSDRWQRRLGTAVARRKTAIERWMRDPTARVIDNSMLLNWYRGQT